MTRRLAPLALALALGWVLLAWGLVALERVFLRERADAHAELERRRDTLELYAEATVRERLAEELEVALPRIERALVDPLEPAADLLLVEDGRQRLPRLHEPLAGDATPAADLLAALEAGHVPRAEGDGPWAERLALLARFQGALAAADADAIEGTVREILAHRLHYRIDATRDLPYMIALLDGLARESRPDPALMRGLLRHGLSDGRGGELRDLTRALLAARDRFTAPDFAALVDALGALSRRAGLPDTELRARAAEPPRVVPSDGWPASRAWSRGWFVEPLEGGAWRGVEIDLAAIAEEVSNEMRRRGLIDARAVLAVEPTAVELRSARFSEEALGIERRFRLKTALVALSAALGLVLVVLAVALQSRRLRWVEMRADFVAAVTHELRTPLASIRLMAETLERRLADSPQARDYPRRIVRAADGLASLVDNILSFNRLEKERWLPRRERVGLGALVGVVAEGLAEEAARELRVDATALADAAVEADPELTRLLFANLMRNALVYNARDPVTIRLAAEREGGMLRIRVEDNGWGIAEAERARVFDDFGRGEEARRRGVAGTGLGLAICRRVVELHGGAIAIAASSPEGTTVELTLPAAAAGAST